MRLSWNEIRTRAAGFAREWADAAYEKGETQSFYNEFFEIFGKRRRDVARYEERVQRLDNTAGYIDLFWPGVLLVEQKSAGRDLTAAREQAGTYFDALTERERPRFQLLCDFQTFELLDRDEREETRFALADLPQHVEKFGFFIGVQRRTFRDQDPVNIEASELIARLHDALKASGYDGHDLELFLGADRVLPVRRRHRHLRATRHLPGLHRGAHGPRWLRPRSAADAPVPGARHAAQPAAGEAGRGPGAVPARER